jgi:hypothetical protein
LPEFEAERERWLPLLKKPGLLEASIPNATGH